MNGFLPLADNDPSQKWECDLPISRLIHLVGGAIVEVWKKSAEKCLLFYPGSLLEPGHYILLISAFYSAGFSVAGLHLAGHGKCLKSQKFTFADLVEQGRAAEEMLRARGFHKIVVCGHSQGGSLTLAHAAASKNLYAAFAIDAFFPDAPSAINLTRFSALAKHRERVIRVISGFARVFPRLPVPLPFYLSLRRVTAAKAGDIVIGDGARRISYPLVFLDSLFSAQIPRRIHCPFWLFAAKDDALFTPEIIQETFVAIEAPAKTLVWLTAGGHMAPFNPVQAQFIAGYCTAAIRGLKAD